MAWDDNTHPVGNSANEISTPHMAGAIVIGALVALVLIRRGFRGVNVAGFSVGIK